LREPSVRGAARDNNSADVRFGVGPGERNPAWIDFSELVDGHAHNGEVIDESEVIRSPVYRGVHALHIAVRPEVESTAFVFLHDVIVRADQPVLALDPEEESRASCPRHANPARRSASVLKGHGAFELMRRCRH